MGDRSAGVFERRNAGRLIEIGAVGASGIDVRHPERSAALRIEIGIENAAAPAELEFKAGPFPNLKRRFSEMSDEFIGGKPVEGASHLRRRRQRRWLGNLAGRSHARGEQEGGTKSK